jgi:hypothetical protein
MAQIKYSYFFIFMEREHVPARIINHFQGLIIQLQKGQPSFALIKEARTRIMEMGV